jgi:hypothetical protein
MCLINLTFPLRHPSFWDFYTHCIDEITNESQWFSEDGAIGTAIESVYHQVIAVVCPSSNADFQKAPDGDLDSCLIRMDYGLRREGVQMGAGIAVMGVIGELSLVLARQL